MENINNTKDFYKSLYTNIHETCLNNLKDKSYETLLRAAIHDYNSQHELNKMLNITNDDKLDITMMTFIIGEIESRYCNGYKLIDLGFDFKYFWNEYKKQCENLKNNNNYRTIYNNKNCIEDILIAIKNTLLHATHETKEIFKEKYYEDIYKYINKYYLNNIKESGDIYKMITSDYTHQIALNTMLNIGPENYPDIFLMRCIFGTVVDREEFYYLRSDKVAWQAFLNYCDKIKPSTAYINNEDFILKKELTQKKL